MNEVINVDWLGSDISPVLTDLDHSAPHAFIIKRLFQRSDIYLDLNRYTYQLSNLSNSTRRVCYYAKPEYADYPTIALTFKPYSFAALQELLGSNVVLEFRAHPTTSDILSALNERIGHIVFDESQVNVTGLNHDNAISEVTITPNTRNLLCTGALTVLVYDQRAYLDSRACEQLLPSQVQLRRLGSSAVIHGSEYIGGSRLYSDGSITAQSEHGAISYRFGLSEELYLDLILDDTLPVVSSLGDHFDLILELTLLTESQITQVVDNTLMDNPLASHTTPLPTRIYLKTDGELGVSFSSRFKSGPGIKPSHNSEVLFKLYRFK